MIRALLIVASLVGAGYATHGTTVAPTFPATVVRASTTAMSPETAPVEPLTARCGDFRCDPPEDCHSCEQDCGSCCGNRRCEPPEDCRSCPQDCGGCH